MPEITRGEEWDRVAEEHDAVVADYCSYVLARHPVLPELADREQELRNPDAYAHRPQGCHCIAARFNRDDYVNALGGYDNGEAQTSKRGGSESSNS